MIYILLHTAFVSQDRTAKMLESYVTPLLMSYVNKYIKNLKPSDLQLSLWGGDVVLSKLDLKLDVLEQVKSFKCVLLDTLRGIVLNISMFGWGFTHETANGGNLLESGQSKGKKLGYFSESVCHSSMTKANLDNLKKKSEGNAETCYFGGTNTKNEH